MSIHEELGIGFVRSAVSAKGFSPERSIPRRSSTAPTSAQLLLDSAKTFASEQGSPRDYHELHESEAGDADANCPRMAACKATDRSASRHYEAFMIGRKS
jgi:hypothetical protein